jgi:hypothetical protein
MDRDNLAMAFRWAEIVNERCQAVQGCLEGALTVSVSPESHQSCQRRRKQAEPPKKRSQNYTSENAVQEKRPVAISAIQKKADLA